MIRVLQFAGCINRYDFIDVIVQRADRLRFEVGVCTATEESNIAPPIYADHTPRWVLGSWTARRNLHRTAWRLAGVLREWRADILHTHHYDEAVIGWLATRFYRRTRLVVGRHYSDAIYRSSNKWKQRGLLALEQMVNRAATRIVAPSSFIRSIVCDWQEVSTDKVDCVPYGFVEEKYAAPRPADIASVRAELGLDGRFVIGNFSRLHEEKGQRYLVDAMRNMRKSIPKVLLLIVGEGAERDRLERQVALAGLRDAVRLLGWRRDAMTLMAAVDVVVQPTLQEAFSQVMAEAMWMEKPLVITDVSGATDIIRDRQNGRLVPKANPRALFEAVTQLADDQTLRRRLGIAGRNFVNENLRIEKVIPQYEEVYLKAMGGVKRS